MLHPVVLVLGVVVIGALVVSLPRLLARGRSLLQVTRALHVDRSTRHKDLNLIASYHNRVAADATEARLDDRTWRDLDLDDVFHSLDHAASEPGRQYLYHLLRSPRSSSEPLARFDGAVRGFGKDEFVANQARDALALLGDQRAASLQELIFGDLPGRPRFWWLFPLLTASSVACLALITIWPRAGLVWLGLCVVNIGVQLYYKPRVKRFIPALHELPAFLRVAARLGELPIAGCSEETTILRAGANELNALRLQSLWLMFEPDQADGLAATIYEYINLLFLLDVNAFVFATETLRDSANVVRKMFKSLGALDAAQSVAKWRRTLPHWVTPDFTSARKALHADQLAHPLLADAVANSLEVVGKSVLITGSNMSGKTTFVRTLGVSAVLAQTLYTVYASEWRAPMLRVRTSIGRTDSLIEGKSYYLAEVESVLALIHAKEDGHQHLFLLDEIYRGTNTTERVAAAYAVLAWLTRGLDMVIVATHDLELRDLLGDAYDTHHFREQVADDNLTFDYRIQSGPSSTRNAIALLKVMQYPDELVADALAAIDWQGRDGRR